MIYSAICNLGVLSAVFLAFIIGLTLGGPAMFAAAMIFVLGMIAGISYRMGVESGEIK